MPVLSEEKISHLSHLVQDALEKDRHVTCKGSRKEILRVIKRTFTDAVALEEAVHDLVQKRLASYSKRIVEGSSEWEILYDKTYREEMNKRRI